MYDQNKYNRGLIFTGVLVFLIIWFSKGKSIDLSIFPIALTASGVTLLIDKFLVKTVLWKYCPNIFCKIGITKTPYLGGEWTGVLQSDYIDPATNSKVPPKEAKVSIIHKFDCIRVQLNTDQVYSSSYVSDIYEDPSERKYLCYIYTGDVDEDRKNNPKHDGAAKLRINDDTHTLEGYYWTVRNTTGTLKLERTNKENCPT